MASSSIEWTELTWNPTTGCDKVSAGCKNCYAEVMTVDFKPWELQSTQPVFPFVAIKTR
jgi:protein gp37